jgi:hypothetical protein
MDYGMGVRVIDSPVDHALKRVQEFVPKSSALLLVPLERLLDVSRGCGSDYNRFMPACP